MKNIFASRTIFFSISILFLLFFSPFLCQNAFALEEADTFKLNEGWMYRQGDSPLNENGIPVWLFEDNSDSKWDRIDNLSHFENNNDNFETTWFKVIIPNVNFQNNCIYFERINGKTIDIYIDNKKVFEKKQTGIYTESPNKVIIPIDQEYYGKYLYMRVSTEAAIKNFGPKADVYIGNYTKLTVLYQENGLNKIIYGNILSFLGIMIVFTSLFLIKNQRMSWLALGLVMLNIGIAEALSINDVSTYFGNKEQYVQILYESVRFIFPNTLMFFFIQVFKSQYKLIALRKMLLVQNLYSALCFVLLFGVLAFEVSFSIYYKFTSDVLGIFYMVELIALLATTVYFSVKRNIEARILLFGFFIFMLSFMIDFIIIFVFDPNYKMGLWIWGAFGFVFSLVAILGRRILENQKRVIKYSEELRISSLQLSELNKTLEQRVVERTQQMENINKELTATNDELYAMNDELISTMEKLKETQEQLIYSEKMAALGHLVAGVAHEINSPLGAIQASTANLSQYMQQVYDRLPRLLNMLSEEEQKLFFNLVKIPLMYEQALSTREERKLKKEMALRLEQSNVRDAANTSSILVDMGIRGNLDDCLQLFQKEESQYLLQTAYSLSGLQRNIKNISLAAVRASKIVFALKNYARQDQGGEIVKADIISSIEMTLVLYQNQMKHGVTVTKNYKDVPEILCYPDELSQVWSNLILNGLQAMEFSGNLQIDVFTHKGNIVVKITDSGTGIPEAIKEKIFIPFFTTKPHGEGTGLGLDIVKKIVLKHKGDIDVESVPGKTTFTVKLPIL